MQSTGTPIHSDSDSHTAKDTRTAQYLSLYVDDQLDAKFVEEMHTITLGVQCGFMMLYSTFWFDLIWVLHRMAVPRARHVLLSLRPYQRTH